MSKEGKCRKVLQFNEYDFRHKQALDILNKHPRNMTELVVNAILHYVSCPDRGAEFSKDGVKKIVLEVLQELQITGALPISKAPPQEEEPPIDSASLNELGDAMSMFRKRG